MANLDNQGNPRFFLSGKGSHAGPSTPLRLILRRDKRHSSVELNVATENAPGVHSSSAPHKTESNLLNSNYTAASSLSRDEAIASTTKDTVVILITLTVIFFTLIATYLWWRRRRCSVPFSASHCNRLEEYRYSRLSQNDVEVDNISFQGDLTHKTLMNSVPVCGEEDGDDDQVRPATLRLEFDSLVSISKDEKETTSSHTSANTKDNAPVDLLIDELSDEDLLQ